MPLQYYYLDIETSGAGPQPDLDNDTIICIQVQPLELGTFKAAGPLQLFKSWEHPLGEQGIVRDFYEKYLVNPHPFDFAPIGFNLSFEFEMLTRKLSKLGKKVPSTFFYYTQHSLDIRDSIILMNRGILKGTKLSNYSRKQGDGKQVLEWYRDKEYAKIEEYVKQEAAGFIELVEWLSDYLSKGEKELRARIETAENQ